ncbi:NAD(P)H-binding protein [Salinicola rhizosphaerae]|uniref:Sugar epimerase YhfK n=1 Tax=Salinicola rhizosphaerae TaxID=1443141 RepID=A0ABQ3E6L4_9GAMM|nr:NAD(P)H-binding protein [Salinicola rhizosphaerae]GHB27844.1 putative sugar epimerase YhfK [Salinicola rhizosphaerae]
MAKTLVLGANGQIGRQFCALAADKGMPIKAMIRDTAQQSWFADRGIETVIGDLEGRLRHAFYGCDQIVFAAGSGPHTGADKTLMIDLHGAVRAIDIARGMGLPRFIMVSALRADRVLEAPVKLRPYCAAKAAADAHLRASGLPYVVLKPGKLTDEPASRQISTDETRPGDAVSRANVAEVLCHLIQHRGIRRCDIALLDGERPIEEALTPFAS